MIISFEYLALTNSDSNSNLQVFFKITSLLTPLIGLGVGRVRQ